MDIAKTDIIDIDLNAGSIYRSFLNHSIGAADNWANRFGVRVFRGKEPVNLEGATCEGFFRNSNGENIALTTQGDCSGNVAHVALPQACYNVEGPFTLTIKVIGSGITGTMRIIDGIVENTNTSGAVAPTETVPTYQEILAVYDEMLEAKEGAVRYDIEQELTAEDREQARNNIGMVLIEFSNISGNEYLMDVSTASEFVQVHGDEYALVLHAD